MKKIHKMETTTTTTRRTGLSILLSPVREEEGVLMEALGAALTTVVSKEERRTEKPVLGDGVADDDYVMINNGGTFDFQLTNLTKFTLPERIIPLGNPRRKYLRTNRCAEEDATISKKGGEECIYETP